MYTLVDVRKYASDRGGRLLSKTYKNANTHLDWQCIKGHSWKSTFSNITRYHWCPVCDREQTRVEKLVTLRKVALKRQGKLLSTEFTKIIDKYRWQCLHGHIWEATGTNVSRGSWCPKCYAPNRALEDLQRLAEAKGGRLVSKRYIKSISKYQWECKKGHRWIARGSSIVAGAWCHRCRGQLITIEDMHERAAAQCGRCLSKKYINAITKLEWQCKRGHKWMQTPIVIKKGYWCHTCAGLNKFLGIEALEKLAREKGGRVLSREYTGVSSRYEWQCGKGHIWKMAFRTVKDDGYWCPECRRSSYRKRPIMRKLHQLKIRT